MRQCLALDLRDDPALIARYEALHHRIWPEVAVHLRSHGVTGMEIHRLGTRMVMVMETDDAVHDPRAMSLAAAIDPKLRKWEALMWTFQAPTPWTPPGDKWTPMACIFRLADAAAD
jgi:L-rhamnose mutarotase